MKRGQVGENELACSTKPILREEAVLAQGVVLSHSGRDSGFVTGARPTRRPLVTDVSLDSLRQSAKRTPRRDSGRGRMNREFAGAR